MNAQKQTFDQLMAALDSRNAESRQDAALELGRLGDARAIEPLVAILRDKKQLLSLRNAAFRSILQIGDAAVSERLLDVLKDKSESQNGRCWAAFALVDLGDPRSFEAILSIIRDSEEDIVARRCAVSALYDEEDEHAVARNTAAVEPLLHALQDPDSLLKRLAAQALYVHGDERAVEPLIRALNDSDSHVRHAAIGTLGRLRDKRAVEPLIAILTARRARSSIPILSFLDGIEKASDRNKSWDRALAASALGDIGARRAVEPLTEALGDRHTNVRGAAAAALGKMQGDEGV